MGKSQQTFNKKEREKKKRKRKQDKLEKREQRKLEREAQGKKTFEEQLLYIDENGHLSETPPDPKKKKIIKASDIDLSMPSREVLSNDTARTGRVKFFDEEKGYGFIIEDDSGDSVFVHINNCQGPLKENNKVTFKVERGPKGMNAIEVTLK